MELDTNRKTDLADRFKITELGPLPKDWQVVALGSLAEISAGGSAPQGHRYFGGLYPFVRVQHLDEDGYEIRRCDYISDIAVHDYRLRLFPRGTIVFPKSGASIRLEKRGILMWDSYLVSHLCAVIPKERVAYWEFLFFVLKTIRFSSDKPEGYPTISLTEIKQRLIPLPPLPEQRAIAQVLRTVQEARKATERVIAALKEVKKSLMRHLFTYGPVPLDKTDQVKLKETKIGLIPAHWRVVKLGQVASFERRPSKNRIQTEEIPFIPMSMIPEDSLYITKWEMRKPDGIRSGIPVFEGDLLLAKITPCLENGKQGIVVSLPNGLGFATTEVIPIRTSKELMSVFLALYFKLPKIRAQLANKMEGTTGRRRLPKSVVESLFVPLPPLSEQQEIARILRTVDEKIEAEEKRKNALSALFKSLLAQLMSGRLRLPKEFVSKFKEEK